MAVFKCKMCGGSLDVKENETIAECEFCGSKQTLTRLSDERRRNLYDRANHFRRNNEFDKAMGIYENILNEDNTDAEAYWSLLLCRYGIEYVEDPVSHKRIPTVNRAQFTSIFDDGNYKSALQYADGYQRTIYESEAKAINEIQKGILAISQKEAPFDVFICYKETDNNGRRTPDSVLAQELYFGLTKEGFKVFFSRITLEDKIGSAYEPYIFAALHSAKVMVVLGTKQEYLNAVWVKNEWSRYLSLIKQGERKTLIPAYKDMDPYDLPDEFSHLQAQDMSKLGFMQDLIRGIGKLLGETQSSSVSGTQSAMPHSVQIDQLLGRANLLLEDQEWKKAAELFERALDQDYTCSMAYLGLFMATNRVSRFDDLSKRSLNFFSDSNFKNALRNANDELKSKLEALLEQQSHNQAQLNTLQEKAGIVSELLKFMVDYKKIQRLVGVAADQPERRFFLGSQGCVEIEKNGNIKTYGPYVLNGWSDIGCSSDNKDLEKWTNVKHLSTTQFHAIALTKVGKAMAYGWSTSACKVGKWDNLISVAAGEWHTVGLKKDGCVVATGEQGTKGPAGDKTNFSGDFCKVESWNDIISIHAGTAYSTGVRRDGNVLLSYGCEDVDLGDLQYALDIVGQWKDMLALVENTGKPDSAFIGVTKDGTIVTTDASELQGMKLFSSLDEINETWLIESKRKFVGGLQEKNDSFSRQLLQIYEAKKKEFLQEIEKLDKKRFILERKKRNVCQYCGGKFSGLFTKKCKDCGREKDYVFDIQANNQTEETIRNFCNGTNSYISSGKALLPEPLIIPSDVSSIGNEAFYYYRIHQTMKSVICAPVLKTIGEKAFAYCNIETVVFSSILERIGKEAFLHCEQLKKIIIPGSVNVIEVGAFSECKNLEYVFLEDGVKRIEGAAFSRCEKLKYIVLPKSIEFVAMDAFRYCNMEHIFFEDPCGWCVDDKSNHSIDEKELTSSGNAAVTYKKYNCYNWEKKSFSSLNRRSTTSACSNGDQYDSDYDNDPQIRSIRRSMKKCQYCGGEFGSFKTCKRCGKKKDY